MASHGNTLGDRLATHGMTEESVERIRIRDFESLPDEGIDLTPETSSAWGSHPDVQLEPYTQIIIITMTLKETMKQTRIARQRGEACV